MQERTINHAIGVLTYWTANDCDRRSLEAELAKLGLGNYLPAVRRPSAILKDAVQQFLNNQLRSTQGSSTLMVRPTKGGVAVVCETPISPKENDYRTTLTATVDENGLITVDPGAWQQDVIDIYRKEREIVTGPQATQCLVRIIDSLGGLRLRENGGLYWINGSKLGAWTAAARAVEQCTLMSGYQHKSVVYILKQLMDEEGVRAVHDAAVSEITSLTRRIQSEVLSGELGKRALQTRQQEAEAAKKKLESLAQFLGSSLATLTDSIQEAETSINAAMFQVMARADEELAVA